MVLHGNYVYANLFEQNDGQNIVIDNSHGANGPHNTFFRNRGSLFGIFFSDNTSPNQNLVGNEIPNTSAPYSAVNYTIQGTGHFVHGNNNKGTIAPSGTSNLPDTSYYFGQRPAEIPSNMWASIGTPNAMNSGSTPATYFYNYNQLFANACGYITDLSVFNLESNPFYIYPNPANDFFTLKGQTNAYVYELLDISGKKITVDIVHPNESIDVSNIPNGMYFLNLITSSQKATLKIQIQH